MRFHALNSLWTLIPLLLLLPLGWIFFENRAQKRFSRFMSESDLFKRARARRKKKFILVWFSLLFAGIALARPQMGLREENVSTQGLDIVFVLDVSNSMLVEDVMPSRIKKAKHVIRNFLERFSGDRAGVVAFAASAYPAVPLTTDYEFVKQTLDVLDETSISNQGSDLAKGVSTGLGLLLRGGANEDSDDKNESSGINRVMIILSDGEDHEGGEAKLVSTLNEHGVRVYSIGVGSLKGGPIPIRDGTGFLRGYKRDRSGGIIASRLESKNIESIAERTGGKFYAASSNEGEVEEIMSIVSTLDRVAGEGRKVIVYDELYQYPLFLSFVLLLVTFLLNETGVTVALFAFAAIGLSYSRPAFATTSIQEYSNTKKGVDAYNAGDFSGALDHFGKAQASDPSSPVHHMNLGDALFKAGSPQGAISEFEETTKSTDPATAARGGFNLGKSYEASQNYEKALQSYQAALDKMRSVEKPDPEIVNRLKKALEQAQQQKEQPSQGQGQGDQKEQKGDKNPQDDKSEQQKKENAPQQPSKTKPKFKPEKLNENDAKRILQQLQENEKKTQHRMMRSKTTKSKDEKNVKDW